MDTGIEQHQIEIQGNREAWSGKLLLRAIYDSYYDQILGCIDRSIPGQVVEIGSGMGNLKNRLPSCISSDIFPNPWLDLVFDGYDLPFRGGSVSHLILFDVLHHIEAPIAFFKEARRVIGSGGRIILFEPYIGLLSYAVYGGLHHEPVAWNGTIQMADHWPRPRKYYAAQGNPTRLFYRDEFGDWLKGWKVTRREAFSAWAYLFSGGFSKPAFYPKSCLQTFMRLDRVLSRWPRLFGGRCLTVLEAV